MPDRSRWIPSPVSSPNSGSLFRARQPRARQRQPEFLLSSSTTTNPIVSPAVQPRPPRRRVPSCPRSGSPRAWPQPSHDHVVRRSAAARQAVPLNRGTCKSPCLPAGLSFLARKRHPLANDGAPHLLGHLISFCSYSDQPAALRRLLDRIGLRSSRQKRAAAFMHGVTLDNEAAFCHRGAKAFICCRFLGVNPNHHHSASAEEIHQPVHCRLKRVKRTSSPIHQRNLILAGWTAAIARRRRQQVSAPLQLHHQFHALRAGYQDSLARRAARERDHRIDNSVAGGNLKGRHHITCFRSFSPVRSRPGPHGDRPFAKPQGFCRSLRLLLCRRRVMRDCLTHTANIFRSGFNFESAATAILYGRYILYKPRKAVMRTAFATSCTLLRRDIRGWAALCRL